MAQKIIMPKSSSIKAQYMSYKKGDLCLWAKDTLTGQWRYLVISEPFRENMYAFYTEKLKDIN